MTTGNAAAPAAESVPSANQAVTVVQPRESAMMLDVTHLAAWAIAIVAIAGLWSLICKALNRELKRDVGEVRHKVSNVAGRVDALEHLRTVDVERIVRVETSLVNVDKSLERIERGQKEAFDQLALSIREVRHVAPR